MRKKIFATILILILIILMAGCKQKYEFNTLSGKPEAIITGVEKSKVVNVLNNEMIKQGYIIEETSEHKLVYEKDVKSLAVSVIYGSEYDSTPRYRIIMNLVDYNNKIRVIATLKIVTNPGSGYEKTEDITYSKSGEKYFKILRNIKVNLEK